MARIRKADAGHIGSKTNFTGGEIKAFSGSKYRHFPHSVQCLYCGSDYMRFAVDGYCQRCQQRAEYILRECPATVERARATR